MSNSDDVARTADGRFATEWHDAEVRIHREDNLFQLEISIETPIGCERYFVRLDEDVADGLRHIWLPK